MEPLRWESATPIHGDAFAVSSILITFIPGHARKIRTAGAGRLAGRAGPGPRPYAAGRRDLGQQVQVGPGGDRTGLRGPFGWLTQRGDGALRATGQGRDRSAAGQQWILGLRAAGSVSRPDDATAGGRNSSSASADRADSGSACTAADTPQTTGAPSTAFAALKGYGAAGHIARDSRKELGMQKIS